MLLGKIRENQPYIYIYNKQFTSTYGNLLVSRLGGNHQTLAIRCELHRGSPTLQVMLAVAGPEDSG